MKIKEQQYTLPTGEIVTIKSAGPEDAEKVRSKSEAFIADTLYEFGIPYRYEYLVRMVNGELRYPDFTLLKVRTEKRYSSRDP